MDMVTRLNVADESRVMEPFSKSGQLERSRLGEETNHVLCSKTFENAKVT